MFYVCKQFLIEKAHILKWHNILYALLILVITVSGLHTDRLKGFVKYLCSYWVSSYVCSMNVKLVTLFLLIVRLMSVSIKIYCPCSVLFTLTMTGRACMHAQSSNKMFIKILSSSALYFLLSKKLNYSCLHSQQPSENNNFCKIILAFCTGKDFFKNEKKTGQQSVTLSLQVTIIYFKSPNSKEKVFLECLVG